MHAGKYSAYYISMKWQIVIKLSSLPVFWGGHRKQNKPTEIARKLFKHDVW